MTGRTGQEKLPSERQAIVHKFSVGGVRGYLTVGMYDDGRPGEVFIDVAKEGSTVSGLLDTVAIAVSFGLQHGVPLEKFCSKFAYTRFEPCGFTGSDFGYAHSIVDYVFRWLAKRFLKEEPVIPADVKKHEEQLSSDSAPICNKCGCLMQRSGSCYCCPSCGTTSGCS